MNIAIAALLLALFSLNVAFASGTPVKIGGYDMVKLTDAMLNGLAARHLIDGKEAEGVLAAGHLNTDDPLVAAASFVDIYRRLGDLLVAKNIVGRGDIEGAEEAARVSGGVKAGGLNPVVLAASYLDVLVRKGIFPLQAAQNILDDSKNPIRKENK